MQKGRGSHLNHAPSHLHAFRLANCSRYATSFDFSTCSTNQYVSFDSAGRKMPKMINGNKNSNVDAISIQKSF